jgi:hypothetical protein
MIYNILILEKERQKERKKKKRKEAQKIDFLLPANEKGSD